MGDEPETFTIHRGLLCRQSPLFEHKLQEDESPLHLDDVDLRTFRLFMAWLYAGKLLTPQEALGEPDHVELVDKNSKREEVVREWTDVQLVRLYIFAKKKYIRRLANDVVTALHQEHDRWGLLTSLDAICELWSYNEVSFLGRLFANERAVHGLDNEHFVTDDFKAHPVSFLVDVLRAVAGLNARRVAGQEVSKLPPASRWHDFRSDVEMGRIYMRQSSRAECRTGGEA